MLGARLVRTNRGKRERPKHIISQDWAVDARLGKMRRQRRPYIIRRGGGGAKRVAGKANLLIQNVTRIPLGIGRGPEIVSGKRIEDSVKGGKGE